MTRWMTIDQKRQLMPKAAACPTMTHLELAKWATTSFKLRRTLGRSTVSGTLHDSARIASKAYGDGSRRKPLKVLSPRLEKRLAEWIKEYEAQNICLTRGLIMMMARDLQGQVCDAWDLNFSVGWLTRFMRRHGLRSRMLHGEAASADPVLVQEGLRALQQVTDSYTPADIYNMDETGLCYAMAPARSICTKTARGVKKTKTRITLALTANADGSDALPILYLGLTRQPRCFGKLSPEQHGFLYRNNEKAWMTAKIYREWLRDLDRDMRAAGRHILLLLDNASSHKSGDLVLTNVRVHRLPPNTTAFLQPMDAGIIAAFKQRYRRRQQEWFFEKMKRHEPLNKNVYSINQRQAMEWSRQIWDDMKRTHTIVNCFRHTGVVFRVVDEQEACSCGEEDDVDDIVLRASLMHL